jgi:hypothetical protein
MRAYDDLTLECLSGMGCEEAQKPDRQGGCIKILRLAPSLTVGFLPCILPIACNDVGRNGL